MSNWFSTRVSHDERVLLDKTSKTHEGNMKKEAKGFMLVKQENVHGVAMAAWSIMS